MARSKVRDSKDLLRGIASGLRVAATRPNINGYVPHERQVSFHASGARGKLFIGGNRSGKTVGGATEAIWRLTGRHPYRVVPPPPVRGRCVSVDFKNGVEKIVKPEIARWLPQSELLGGSWDKAYNKELNTLTLENGSFLEFMSYDQELDKFAGTSRHFIWFDEEPPQEIFTECKLRLLDTAGDWWITMTPVEGMTWVYDDIYNAAMTDPLLYVVEVDTTMNPHLNPGEIDVIMSGLSKDEVNARIHGRFIQRGGLIYKNFSEQKNVIDAMIPPKEWLHFCMMDAGFNNPTCWLWAAVDSEGRMIVYDEHYESGLVVQEHAKFVHAKNQQHGIIPSYNVGDPSIKNVDPITGTSVQIEYVDNGIPIMLGNHDVKAGINAVATRIGHEKLPPRLFITRNCLHTLWEIQRYRWATWATKKHNFEKNAKEEPHKKDDHAMDALRYGVASRPLLEDLSIPEGSPPPGASVGVDPYADLRDPGVGQTQLRRQFDETLGEDW